MAASIALDCPHCGASFRAPPKLAGRTVRCKACRDAFRVPELHEPAHGVGDTIWTDPPADAIVNGDVVDGDLARPLKLVAWSLLAFGTAFAALVGVTSDAGRAMLSIPCAVVLAAAGGGLLARRRWGWTLCLVALFVVVQAAVPLAVGADHRVLEPWLAWSAVGLTIVYAVACVALLLRPEHVRAFTGKPSRRIWVRHLAGSSLMVFGWAFAVVALAAIGFVEQKHFESTTDILIAGAVGVSCGFLGLVLVGAGRRVRVPRGVTLLEDDARPPVVYLRPFAKDEAKSVDAEISRQALRPQHMTLLAHLVNRTIEDELSDALSALGPCVAVGRPGERFAPAGMSRVYLSDPNWQREVAALMERAVLVVLRVGREDAGGFWWEVEHAVETLPPERLLFAFPDDEWAPQRQTTFEVFREQFSSATGRTLPSDLGTGYFLAFDADWTPHALPVEAAQGWSGLLVQRTKADLLRRTLVPIAHRLGKTIRIRTTLDRLVARAISVAVVLYALGVLTAAVVLATS